MLKLFDENKTLLNEWKIESIFEGVEVYVHKTDILHIYQDDLAITIFYGFLDMEYGDNAAKFINTVIANKGINGLNTCYGSFILLRYDCITQELIVTNDALGDFAAHYYQKDGLIQISDLPDLLLTAENSMIRQDRVIHYFAISKPLDNAAFFEEIKQVNPGQYLIFSDRCVDKKYYYKPPEIVDFKSKSIEALSDQFKDLIQQAIKLQTRGHERVGVMLSGGMDSTFVAANGLKAGKKISTFSYVFPNTPEANESIWIDSMRSLSFDMNTFVGDSYWPLKSPIYASINAPVNNQYRPLKDVIYQKAESQGIKILLSGVFADHLYTGYIYWLVDQARRSPFAAIKSLYKTMKQLGIKTGLKQVSPKKWSHKLKPSAPWLNLETTERFNEIKQNNNIYNHPHPQQFALVYGLSTAQFSWLDHEHGYRHNLFVRHPFRDRRVVEFLMSLPAWILGTVNQTKKLVRYASKDMLPDVIIRRRKITTLLPIMAKGLLDKEFEKVKKILTNEKCSWQNYIQEDLVQKILNNPKKAYDERDFVLLWQCLSYEMWQTRLRSLSK